MELRNHLGAGDRLTLGGVNLRTVQTLLGHKDRRMTMRYTHLCPAHLKEAVTALDRSLSPISNGHSVGTRET